MHGGCVRLTERTVPRVRRWRAVEAIDAVLTCGGVGLTLSPMISIGSVSEGFYPNLVLTGLRQTGTVPGPMVRL